MRIAILADRIEPQLGGAIGVAYQQAIGLARRGHEVTVIAASVSVGSDSGVTFRAVNAHFHERFSAYLGLHHPAAVSQVRAIVADVKPEVVHAHNLYAALSYRCLAEARQVCPRVFLTAHDVQSFAYAKLTHFIPHHLRHPVAEGSEEAPPPATSSAQLHQSDGTGQVNPLRAHYPERFNYHTPWWVNLRTAKKRYNPVRNLIIRRHLKRLAKVFAVSQALADALLDNRINNVAVLRNGLDLAPWQPAAAGLETFRQQHGLAGRRVVLLAGRLSGAKGINQILEALRTVARAVPQVLLVVAGDAEGAMDRYHQLPQQYGVSRHVVFTGHLDAPAMVSAYAAAEVVVVPSVCFDSFPSTNLEAMAAGKPVVATCFGGSREAVLDGQTGFIVNPYDTALLAERVTRLLTQPTLAIQMGQAGRRRVEQEFSLDRWLDQLEGWYKKTG